MKPAIINIYILTMDQMCNVKAVVQGDEPTENHHLTTVHLNLTALLSALFPDTAVSRLLCTRCAQHQTADRRC